MKKVEAFVSFPEMEERILAYWKEEGIFERTLQKEAPEGMFVFYDGPPFATGLPHYGHFVPGLVKDIFPRFKTMQGYRVERQWGWDCHGLPIENIVEKELGFKSKQEIVKFGVEKFNELCRTKVLSYAEDWKTIMGRFGRFVDMKNAYRTMDPEYMESVWWVWKSLWDKELIYESYRTMHICPRCETTLSQQEVSEGYKDIKDLAVTVKFELADEPGTFLLAWTTTPWTLPGNVALAVNKDIEYVKVKDMYVSSPINTDPLEPLKNPEPVNTKTDFYILSKDSFETYKKDFRNNKPKILEEFLGNELVGKKYTPPFTDYFDKKDLENHKNGWAVYHADFVTTEMGTGIAHEAPAFGEDDMLLSKEHHLPWVQHVNMDGTVKTEVKEFAGMQVKPIDDPTSFDVSIIKSLAQKGLLFAKERYEHSYPHCWRCDTPLLNYATSSWFVAVEKIKDLALENAKNISWSPAHIKAGRFGKWLEGARDWSVSRQRFWASCIPIWECACGERVVIGSRQELEEKSGEKVEDLHKHRVDKMSIPCPKCDGIMKRVPDVMDTWFDSGSMPYASQHYMGAGEVPNFPAHFIAEGVDQTRAWFYYLHILGTALTGKNTFLSAVVNGVVLAEDGKKMSKKLNNYPDPVQVINKYGADALRLYIATSPVVSAENLSFSEKDLESITKNTFRMLWNSYSFFTTYATLDNWSASSEQKPSENILDRWILAELNELIESMTTELNNYQPAGAARLIMPFVDNLSNWYIRRSRKRFWKPARPFGGNENDRDKNDAYQTLYTVLVELSKLMAPFTPFIAEEIYRNLTGGKSVHLEKWPEVGVSDFEVTNQMNTLRELVTVGLQRRSEIGIKVRQPLQSVTSKFDLQPEYQEILKEELNIKEIAINQGQKEWLIFDESITPELKIEGKMREVIRAIQEGRKKAGFNIEDRITLGYQGMENVFEVHNVEIASETLAEGGVHNKELTDAGYTETVNVEGQDFTFWLKRV